MTAAVIPMKPIDLAKCRLADALGPEDRRTLVRTMLCDVVKTLCASKYVDCVYVVTADPDVAELVAPFGAIHIAEAVPRGLNSAINTAAHYLEGIHVDSMLVLPGDVPLATVKEIDTITAAAHPRIMTIVPDHERAGTNAILLSPPGAIAVSFGPGSYEKHIEIAARASMDSKVWFLNGLGRDIDDPGDLELLKRNTTGRPDYAFLNRANLQVSTEQAGLEEPQNI